MSLQELFRGLVRGAWLLVLFVVVGVVVAVVYVKTVTPVYTARTQLFVNASDDAGTLSTNLNGSQLARNNAPSYAQIVAGPSVLGPAAATLKTTEAALAPKVSASVVYNTTIIEVSVRDRSGTTAAQIASTVATQAVTTLRALQSSSGLSTQSQIRIDIVRPATVPTTPTSPRPATDLAVGAIVGLGVGVIAASATGRLTPRRPEETARGDGRAAPGRTEEASDTAPTGR